MLIFFVLFQSHNDDDMSDGDGGHSGVEHDDLDSCDEIRRHGGLLAEHGDVLAKLKMQVRDIKVGVRSFNIFFLFHIDTLKSCSFYR